MLQQVGYDQRVIPRNLDNFVDQNGSGRWCRLQKFTILADMRPPLRLA